MGYKLGKDALYNSIGALQKYFSKKNKKHGPFVTEIEIVDKETNEIERLEVSITISLDNISHRINIMWEDAGYSDDEFRDKGLYGYYDCTWVPMNFEHNKLSINSPDSDKIIYVY